jgi:hypothetical protein
VYDLDVVHRDAELVGENLGEGGLLALPVWLGPDEDVYFATWVEADDRAFPQSALEAHRASHL